MMSMSVNQAELLHALCQMGLAQPDEVPVITPLSGGVSCDIFRVDLEGGTLCIKQALPQLRVKAEWHAPVSRSQAEVEWLDFALNCGVSVPEILGTMPERSLFAMSWLDPATHPVWKRELAEGRIDPAFAGEVGAALALVHARSSGDSEIASRFANHVGFHALRLDPFFLHTANQHPDLAGQLNALAERTGAARIALMHGDVSPKNILCGHIGPVFLDAECACIGDPAFDLAFCLMHLLLKGVWHPEWCPAYGDAFLALADSYVRNADWEETAHLEQRICELLAALLLARVDGKSPAEYLVSEQDKAFVRTKARSLIAHPTVNLHAFLDEWSS